MTIIHDDARQLIVKSLLRFQNMFGKIFVDIGFYVITQ